MRLRIFLKVFGAFLVVILATAALMDLFVLARWERSLHRQIEASLIQKTAMFAQRLAVARPGTDLRPVAADVALAGDVRATIIARSGAVLADTEADPRVMENHAARPEFAAALKGQPLTIERWSQTRHQSFLYAAAPIPGGAVRLAVPLVEVEQTMREVRLHLALVTLFAIAGGMVIAAMISHFTAQRLERIITFSQRVAAGDLAARLPVSRDELGALSTSLNETAAKLERSFAELQQMERTRRDFTANVSHELRTPLTAIKGFAETLAEDPAIAAEQRNFLQIIGRNAHSMSRLTADILRLAELESSEPHLHFAAVPAAQLVQEAFSAWQGRTGGISISVEQIAPRLVRADPESIAQVFGNLIENAVRYGATGGRIELAARESEGGVEFSVRDFGEGIPQEHLARLFERFYRVDKARSRTLGGTGLGLAIVKHIVLLHGGSVRVQSTPGRGATFHFVLPYADAALASSR